MLNQLLRPVIRNVARSGTRSSSHSVVDYKPPTINDIPLAKGSWQEHHDKQQRVYNAQLALGITALVSTIAFIKVSGIIFFNWGPPEEPTEK